MNKQARILIVDDESFNIDYLEQELDDLDCETSSAQNGREALQQVTSEAPDVILLDIMMPEMDGFQVLAHLKANKTLRDIPVIIISALGDIGNVVKGIEMGAEDYLPKPFDPVLLKARIGACLEKKRLRDREVLYLQQIEAEKKRADELLHVILPSEIVEELKVTNTVKPRYYQDVAVLFADVVGFTPYCDAHTPEEVVSNLQELVQAYEDLALRYDLQKIKTVGDAFITVAGLLKPLDNPVLNCVKCGLEMIPPAQRLPAEWHVRVGIHVGPLIAGVVGHRQYLFDVFGDTVNTAQRIESYGIVDSVNLSREAWGWVSDQFRGESLGFVQVKGKGELEIIRVKTEMEEDALIRETILHYKVMEKLSEGGMGVVYKAEDTRLKREVAIKFLPRQIVVQAEQLERFKFEARTAAALNHPNIATIYAIEEVDDESFIVMEYIHGQELRQKVSAGPLELGEALDIAIQIAEGLQAAHKKGIVPRDIKSANIMLAENGQVKILDFGLAKLAGQTRLTEPGRTMGTLAYMSPEQMQGQEIDHRTDIWSLGVILYEMVTGQLPFKGEFAAMMYSIFKRDPEPPTSLQPDLPDYVEQIVYKALEKDRTSRYQNIQDLLRDLKERSSARSSSSRSP
jgi:adenylate cyclase